MISKQEFAEIRIGTSGFSYADWKGPFYPSAIRNDQMLEFYCRHFDVIEINATYYTFPKAVVFEKLNQKTPDDFEFIVKVHQETTHRRRDNENAIRAILDAVQPIRESGKLKGFLAQFPYSFKNTEQARRYLSQTKQLLKEHELFVEFRNYTWNKEALFNFLQQHQIGYVNVDEPKLQGLVPPQDVATTKMGYVRFHGRNEKDWWDGKGSARYDYLYTPDELREWLTRIGNILKKTYKTYIFFNNHPQGKAIKNAKEMMEILKKNLDKIK